MDTDSVVFSYNHLNLLNVHLSVATQTHNPSLPRSQLPPHLLHPNLHKNTTQTQQTVAYKAKQRSRYTPLMVSIAHQSVHIQAAQMLPVIIFHQRKKIIKWFFNHSTLDGNVEATYTL